MSGFLVRREKRDTRKRSPREDNERQRDDNYMKMGA